MEAGVEVIVKTSHTLYDLDKIIELNGGQPPLTYKCFQTLVSRLDPPEMPVETMSETVMGRCVTPISEDHGDKYGVPSLDELGFDTEGLPTAVWPGGETEALTRIERHLERKAWVANFERPRMNANSLLASPTGLSPYLRFGCLSCRLFYFKLTELYRKVKKNSSPPLSLYGQLLWREFFYTTATNHSRFDKMEGNSICVSIPWGKNAEALVKWPEAKTGFPWQGKIFEELLLGADWSVNAGSWMCLLFSSSFSTATAPWASADALTPTGTSLGLLASVPSTNGNGNGGMMAYSLGEQQPGNNNNSHLPGVSGSSIATGTSYSIFTMKNPWSPAADDYNRTRNGTDTTQCQKPPRPSPAAKSTTSLLCLNTQTFRTPPAQQRKYYRKAGALPRAGGGETESTLESPSSQQRDEIPPLPPGFQTHADMTASSSNILNCSLSLQSEYSQWSKH